MFLTMELSSSKQWRNVVCDRVQEYQFQVAMETVNLLCNISPQCVQHIKQCEDVSQAMNFDPLQELDDLLENQDIML